MKNVKYDEIAARHKAPKNRIKNSVYAFICGGLVGLLGELIIELFINFGFSRSVSSTIMILIFIFISCLFTALGFFDKWVSLFQCGLIIPITGFAHSMMSSCLDYKREGMVTGMGANTFKLAGSVIVYGVVSAVIISFIRYVVGGIV